MLGLAESGVRVCDFHAFCVKATPKNLSALAYVLIICAGMFSFGQELKLWNMICCPNLAWFDVVRAGEACCAKPT
jgi:hypothetical protein